MILKQLRWIVMIVEMLITMDYQVACHKALHSNGCQLKQTPYKDYYQVNIKSISF